MAVGISRTAGRRHISGVQLSIETLGRQTSLGCKPMTQNRDRHDIHEPGARPALQFALDEMLAAFEESFDDLTEALKTKIAESEPPEPPPQAEAVPDAKPAEDDAAPTTPAAAPTTDGAAEPTAAAPTPSPARPVAMPAAAPLPFMIS